MIIYWHLFDNHFIVFFISDVIISTVASQITSLMIIYSTVYSCADQGKHQSPVSLAFVRGIHRWPVNSPHKGPVTRKMFPFDDVIISIQTFFVCVWIWCDAVCDVMRWEMWCDVMMWWYGKIRYTIYDIRDMMWCDVMWCDVMWCDMIWYDMIWYDMIWYMITHLPLDKMVAISQTIASDTFSRMKMFV